MSKGGFSTIIVIFIAVFILVGLCISFSVFASHLNSSPVATFTSKSQLQHQPDSCNLINGSNFTSVSKYEGGLGPNGAVLINYALSFKANSVDWYHSDVSENGSYSCQNNVLQLNFNNEPTYTIYYDPALQILNWSDIEYRKTN